MSSISRRAESSKRSIFASRSTARRRHTDILVVSQGRSGADAPRMTVFTWERTDRAAALARAVR